MTLASDLRAIVTAARPTVEEWIDIGEQFVGFRDACKAKGLDWGQIKALIKAQVLDEKDNGERVAKIVEKADFASSYAAMLGLLPDNMNENNFSDTPLVPEQKATPGNIAEPAPRQEQAGTDIRAEDPAQKAASRKAPSESPGSPMAAEGLVSHRDRYVRGHATVNADQREHGQQTASSEDVETHPPKAAVGMTAGETAPHSDDDEDIPEFLRRYA